MISNPCSGFIRLVALAIVALFVIGCSTTSPTLDTEPGTEVTFDGLYPVRNSRMDKAWASRDIDLSQYSKVMLGGAGIEYRPGGETGRSYFSRSTTHFAVSEDQKKRLRDLLTEVFLDELGSSDRFTLVDKPGPDVLLVEGKLLDVVSYVPPEPLGSSDIYLSRVGEATLVLEIRDSETDAIFARAIDRRAAENWGMDFTRSNRVSNQAEVRRMAQSWARQLRTALEEQLGPTS